MSRDKRKELRSEGQMKNAVEGPKRPADASQPHDDGTGQFVHADQAGPGTLAPSSELPGEGRNRHVDDEGQNRPALSWQPQLQDDGPPQVADEGQYTGAYVLQPIIRAIRFHHRSRIYAMDQRKRSDQVILVFLKSNVLGWSKGLPKPERDAIAERASALIEVAEAEVEIEDLTARLELSGRERLRLKRLRIKAATDDPIYLEYRPLITTQMRVRAPFARLEAAYTGELERLAETLPVWAFWGEHVRGFSARALGTIIGEAGDLSSYPKKGHLWKRMGLAVMGAGDGIDDRRQGGLSKSAAKEDWIAHGYSRVRRSLMFVIGDVLIKAGGDYYQVYFRRKAYERAKAEAKGLTVAPTASIPKKRAAEFMSEGHIHRRAQRYMEKRLLRDLWNAWRSANVKMPLDGPSIVADRHTPDQQAA